MNRFHRLAVLLFATAVLFTFLGCQTPAGRSAGQVVDDATITTKVKTKIFGDSILKGFAISVETFKGEVTLTGAVDNEWSKGRAERVAKSTTGVLKVHNLIKIK